VRLSYTSFCASSIQCMSYYSPSPPHFTLYRWPCRWVRLQQDLPHTKFLFRTSLLGNLGSMGWSEEPSGLQWMLVFPTSLAIPSIENRSPHLQRGFLAGGGGHQVYPVLMLSLCCCTLALWLPNSLISTYLQGPLVLKCLSGRSRLCSRAGW